MNFEESTHKADWQITPEKLVRPNVHDAKKATGHLKRHCTERNSLH